MDFMEGLGDTSGVWEVPVDDIGRVEVRHDRARVTLVTYRAQIVHPALCLVWGVGNWKAARRHHEMMHELICGNLPDPDMVKRVVMAHHH